jgi:cell division septal protein FtsQ
VYGRPTPPRRGNSPQFQLSSPGWGVIASVALTLFVIIAISRLTALQKITVTGLKSLSQDRVLQITKDGINKQWFGQSLLLINSNDLASYLSQQEPAIKQAQIHRHFFHSLQVSVIEREPSLNWKTNNQTYLLDQDGTVIGPGKGEYSQLPSVTDTTNLPVKVGDRAAPTQFVTFTTALNTLLPSTKLKAVDMQIPATTSELYVKTDRGYTVKFDTTRPAAGEVGDLITVLAHLASIHKAPAEYIDLRIEHKAYYK